MRHDSLLCPSRPISAAASRLRSCRARCACLAFLLGSMTAFVHAQDGAPLGGGLKLKSVTAYFDYYSSALPNVDVVRQAPLEADGAAGGSVQVGWTRWGERAYSSFSYTSSLIGRMRYSEWNAWNHSFAVNTHRKIAPRWALNFSAAGDFSSREQAIFSPTQLGNVASASASFDDLSAAMLSARYSSPQLAAALANSPVSDSPVRSLLYGQRMLTVQAKSSLAYSFSPRFNMSFQSEMIRTQHVSDPRDRLTQGADSYMLSNSTSGNGGIAFQYFLSAHTDLGVSVTVSRASSNLQDAYTTTSLVSLGSTVGLRWFYNIRGGIGASNPVRQTYPAPTQPLPAGGASLGFKTLSHTFLAAFDRTVSDSYGVGAAVTTSGSFTWRWRQPGRAWWLKGSTGWQELTGDAFGRTSGLRFILGFGRILNRHFALYTQYAYQGYSWQLRSALAAQDQMQSAVRVSVIWSPHPEDLAQ